MTTSTPIPPRPPIPSTPDPDDDSDEPSFTKPPKPGRSRPLNAEEQWASVKASSSLGLCIIIPLLIAMPPRKFDGYTAIQGAMLMWAANEQSELRTGNDLMYHSEAPIRWARGRIRAARRRRRGQEEGVAVGEGAEDLNTARVEGLKRLKDGMAVKDGTAMKDGRTSVTGEVQRALQQSAGGNGSERADLIAEVQNAMKNNPRESGYWDRAKGLMWPRPHWSSSGKGREG